MEESDNNVNQEALSPLWDEETIEVHEDGFLWLRDDSALEDNESQPLLLRSSTVFLQQLYPHLSDMQEILKEKGYPLVSSSKTEGQDQDESPTTPAGSTKTDDSAQVETKSSNDDDKGESNEKEAESTNDDSSKKPKQQQQKRIPAEYDVYQHLERCDNLANRMQTVLLDIQYLRHRTTSGKKQPRDGRSRENRRVQAIQAQQERLQQQLQKEEQRAAAADDSDDNNDNDDEFLVDAREPQSIRLVRTINSIRAVFPHLIPILKHPKRDDKQLIIKKTKYKAKRRPMSWILGRYVFDTTTSKNVDNLYDDTKRILNGYIPFAMADQIIADPFGMPLFWAKWWVPQLLEKIRPKMENPLWIVAESQDQEDIDAIKERGWKCDELLESLETSVPPEFHDKYDKAVKKLHKKIETILVKHFPGARVSVYGSCLSNLSLGKGADVDLSLWIPQADKLRRSFQAGETGAERYTKDMKNMVYQAARCFSRLRQEFRKIEPITRARVPVISGIYNHAANPYSDDGSINFDICFLNDIAVANSGLLREYSTIDTRVRGLMLAVKRWAKEYELNSAKDNHISSYAWVNLVIFYLQCIRFVPNLQDAALMTTCGMTPDPSGNYWHSVNNLDTWYLTWDQVQQTADAWTLPPEFDDMSVSGLLYGFFEFYALRFPAATYAVSMKSAAIRLPRIAFVKQCVFFCIEDPFETHDSHCPHDLGTPASEGGARHIMKLFHEAETHLLGMLCGKIDINIDNGGRLWPRRPHGSEPASSSGAKKKGGQFRRFEAKQNNNNNNTSNNNNRGKNNPKPKNISAKVGAVIQTKTKKPAPVKEARSPSKNSKATPSPQKKENTTSKEGKEDQKKEQPQGSNNRRRRRGGRGRGRGRGGGRGGSGGDGRAGGGHGRGNQSNKQQGGGQATETTT